MSQLYGADVAELRALAKEFQAASMQLLRGCAEVSAGIHISAWVGPFAATFRLSWDSEHSVRMRQAAKILETAASALKRNAEEQERASAADGGSTRSGRSSASGPLYDRAQTSSAVGLGAPTSAAGLWWTLKGMTDNAKGYRIQTVLGNDGKTRIIMYINGTYAGKDLTLWGNVPAAAGARNKETDLAIAALANAQAENPGAEIMLVGYSQGGIIVQNIADTGVFNVKQIVTYGSPIIPSVNNYGGADITRITDGADVIPAFSIPIEVVRNPVEMGLVRAALFATKGFTPASPGADQSFQYNSVGAPLLVASALVSPVEGVAGGLEIHENPQTYGGDAAAFDNDPSAYGARGVIQRFTGTVTSDPM
ncbi:MAG TPA: hypothetical protein VIJ18_08825 [Microbacteriaceae bacterium]